MQRIGSYLDVFWTFARNSLIREMTFRANFLMEAVTSVCWTFMQLGFYTLVYGLMERSSPGAPAEIAGWDRYEFFVFIATTILINSLVEALFMPNVQELSELVRLGNMDFALLKPIDTQFLVSLQKIQWSSLSKVVLGLFLLVYALPRIEGWQPSVWQFVLYPLYIAVGALILYSLMITLAATSIWLGRNQSLYDFWFYITNFARYPMEIYRGPYGDPLRQFFTWIIPVMVVVNVPASLLARPFVDSPGEPFLDKTRLAAFAIFAMVAALLGSRWVFQRALASYRSASS